MTFLPNDYKVPEASSGYMKLVKWENRIRIVSQPKIGYETRVEEEGKRKPVRTKTATWVEGERHFWAFAVYDYESKQVKVLEITQKGIMWFITSLVKREGKSDPKLYDFYIERKWDGMETEYIVTNGDNDSKENTIIKESIKLAESINLEALFVGWDPFVVVNMPVWDVDLPF